jgi:hypothetical protein
MKDLREIRAEFRAAVEARDEDKVTDLIASGVHPITFSEREASAKALAKLDLGEEGTPVEKSKARIAANILIMEHMRK